MISLVERANRALQSDMVRAAHESGFIETRYSHNSLFGFMWDPEGARTVELAQRAGITRQSMGEVVRDLVALGVVEMVPDPADGRAKLVRFTDKGLAQARQGYAHIRALEHRFAEDLGDDYEAARRVLQRVAEILQADLAQDA